MLVRWNRNGTYISPAEFIPSVNDIDEFQKELKEGLLAKGIHSLILAPMWKDGRLIGFVGTDKSRNSSGASGSAGRLPCSASDKARLSGTVTGAYRLKNREIKACTASNRGRSYALLCFFV